MGEWQCRWLLWLVWVAVLSAILVTRVLLPSMVLVRCNFAGMTKQHLSRVAVPFVSGINVTALFATLPPSPFLAPNLPTDRLVPPVDLAVIAGSSKNRYAFYLPLTALVWRLRVGMIPLVLLAGDRWEGGADVVVRETLEELQRMHLAHVIRVPCDSRDATFVSQGVRLAFAALPQLHPDSWAVINDADLWPVDMDMYRIGKHERGVVTSHNSQCCGAFEFRGAEFVEVPMGSVGARVSDWRDVFLLPNRVNPDALAALVIQRAEAMTASNRRGWGDDQMMLSVMLQSSTAAKEGRVHYHTRATAHDRIDRLRWPAAACFESLVPLVFDAHLPTDGANMWFANLRVLFRLLIPNRTDVWEMADRYVARFRAHDGLLSHS
jgi:hypothetical protein